MDRDAKAAPPAQFDGKSFLADYWGDEWPRVEAALRQQEGWADYDLSKLPEPPPLDVALPKLRELMVVWRPGQREEARKAYLEIGPGSGELTDRQWIQSKYAPDKPLSDADFATIAAHVGPAQLALEDSADRLMDAILRARTRLFDQGERTLSPYTSVGSKNPREWKPGLLNAQGVGWEGWCAGVMVLQSDIPEWEELRRENLRLTEERNRALQEIIKEL